MAGVSAIFKLVCLFAPVAVAAEELSNELRKSHREYGREAHRRWAEEGAHVQEILLQPEGYLDDAGRVGARHLEYFFSNGQYLLHQLNYKVRSEAIDLPHHFPNLHIECEYVVSPDAENIAHREEAFRADGEGEHNASGVLELRGDHSDITAFTTQLAGSAATGAYLFGNCHNLQGKRFHVSVTELSYTGCVSSNQCKTVVAFKEAKFLEMFESFELLHMHTNCSKEELPSHYEKKTGRKFVHPLDEQMVEKLRKHKNGRNFITVDRRQTRRDLGLDVKAGFIWGSATVNFMGPNGLAFGDHSPPLGVYNYDHTKASPGAIESSKLIGKWTATSGDFTGTLTAYCEDCYLGIADTGMEFHVRHDIFPSASAQLFFGAEIAYAGGAGIKLEATGKYTKTFEKTLGSVACIYPVCLGGGGAGTQFTVGATAEVTLSAEINLEAKMTFKTGVDMTGHHFISYDIGRPAGQEIVVHDSDHQTQKRPLEWTAEVKASAELALNLYAKVGSTWKFPDVVELTATAGFKLSFYALGKLEAKIGSTISQLGDPNTFAKGFCEAEEIGLVDCKSPVHNVRIALLVGVKGGPYAEATYNFADIKSDKASTSYDFFNEYKTLVAGCFCIPGTLCWQDRYCGGGIAAGTCSFSCILWTAIQGSCSAAESAAGADCSYCADLCSGDQQARSVPQLSVRSIGLGAQNTCSDVDGCEGFNCDYWSGGEHDFYRNRSCLEMEGIYGCDCSGCACNEVEPPDDLTLADLVLYSGNEKAGFRRGYGTSTGAPCVADEDCEVGTHLCYSSGICSFYDENYCKKFNCLEGDGDCDSDEECAGDLLCGSNNGAAFHTGLRRHHRNADICYASDGCSSDSDCHSNQLCIRSTGNCHTISVDKTWRVCLDHSDCLDTDPGCGGMDHACAAGYQCGAIGGCASMHPDRDAGVMDVLADLHCCEVDQDYSATIEQDCDGADELLSIIRPLIGDGICHDGTDLENPYNLDCEEFEFDGLDCNSTLESKPHDVDCDGKVILNWISAQPLIGDGTCQGPGDRDYNFDCAAFNFDGRDCDKDSICSLGGCHGFSCDEILAQTNGTTSCFELEQRSCDCTGCVCNFAVHRYGDMLDCDSEVYTTAQSGQLGDGKCDAGGNTYTPNFSCDKFYCDEGDCRGCSALACVNATDCRDDSVCKDGFCEKFGSVACSERENGCSLGEGVCFSNLDCAGDLVCGTNNCHSMHPSLDSDVWPGADCCVSPGNNSICEPSCLGSSCDEFADISCEALEAVWGCSCQGCACTSNCSTDREICATYEQGINPTEAIRTESTSASCTDCGGTDCSDVLSWVGDGTCDLNFACDEFSCDGGDCECSNPATEPLPGNCRDCFDRDCTGLEHWVGDGYCDNGLFGLNFNCSAWSCDGGDCPGCSNCADCDGNDCDGFEHWLGDGFCDDGTTVFLNFNCETFSFDNDDCAACIDCEGKSCEGLQHWIADGLCDEGQWGITFNCAEFNNDGGDCSSNCTSPSSSLGDGHCDPGLHNTQACGWDGGDCCEQTCNMNADCQHTEDVFLHCLDPVGGPRCSPFDASTLGNGVCDDAVNSAICHWDGGDCCPSTCNGSGCSNVFDCLDPNATDSGTASACQVSSPEWLGDGFCDAVLEPEYNSASCNWDGGDCCQETCVSAEYDCAIYDANQYCVDPNVQNGTVCTATMQHWLGDGYCDGGDYNTAACNWDSGDCCPETCTPVEYLCLQELDELCLDPSQLGQNTSTTGSGQLTPTTISPHQTTKNSTSDYLQASSFATLDKALFAAIVLFVTVQFF